DIDGTLLNDRHELTAEVKQAVQQANEQGIRIVLCTGRPLPGVQAYLEELNLFSANDYVITYNGSLVQNTHSGEIIARYGMTIADFLDIEVLARKLGVHMHATNEEAIYTPN